MKKSDSEIVKVLNLGLKGKTTQDVVGVMESLRIHFKKHKEKSFIPFLETYFIVTCKVLDKKINRKGYFKNLESLDKVDSIFASLYFEFLKKYIEKGEGKTPWKNYLKYCKRKDGKTFVQMLLGINSHINGDLPFALYKSNYKNKKDFMKINLILKNIIPEVMEFIFSFGNDFLGLGGIVFKKEYEKYFKKIVVRWRKNAWNNYKKLNSENLKSKSLEIKKQTEDVALEIIEIFEEIYKIKKIGKNKKRLLKLIVKL